MGWNKEGTFHFNMFLQCKFLELARNFSTFFPTYTFYTLNEPIFFALWTKKTSLNWTETWKTWDFFSKQSKMHRPKVPMQQIDRKKIHHKIVITLHQICRMAFNVVRMTHERWKENNTHTHLRTHSLTRNKKKESVKAKAKEDEIVRFVVLPCRDERNDENATTWIFLTI